MKKIVLCPNPYRDHGLRMTQKVREILAEEGIESVIKLYECVSVAISCSDFLYF